MTPEELLIEAERKMVHLSVRVLHAPGTPVQGPFVATVAWLHPKGRAVPLALAAGADVQDAIGNLDAERARDELARWGVAI